MLVAVAQVSLQGSRIMALGGQGEAAGLAEHVRVNLEAELGGLAGALDELGEAGGREWTAAL